jgi:sortase A
MLDVPRLKLSTPVIEGDDDRTLQRAVGHLPDTPLPWEAGNSAIAGHRDGLFRPLKPRTTLTLITCYPFYYVGSAPQRFVVHAEREQPRSSP